MSFEDQLRSDLGSIQVPEAVSPLPNLADSVLTGMRRQNRRRAVIGAGCLAIAVAAASLTASVWRSPQPNPNPVAPTETTHACSGPLPTRSPSATREYFDPLTLEIDASRVTGYRVKTAFVQTYYQGMELTNKTGDRSVGVLLYAAGGEPHYYDTNGKAIAFDPGAGPPAGFVGGAPAYWLPSENLTLVGTGTRHQGIAWQWAPGAWAFVLAYEAKSETPTPSLSTVDQAALRTIASQVAPQLGLGVDQPVKGPFSMPVPNCTRLTTSVIAHDVDDHGVPYTAFLLGFDTADRIDPTFPPAGDTQTSLVVMADTAAGPKVTDNLTPYPGDLGHPAYVSEGLLSVYEVSGFAVNVWPFEMPNAGTEAEKASLAAAVFRTMTFYPGAAGSEETWGDPIVA